MTDTQSKSTVVSTVDLHYKNGYVSCACGWRKELGDGFNGYMIDICPSCTPTLQTRSQSQVTTGRPGHYIIEQGRFVYFVLSNGIHVQYSAYVYHTQYRKQMKR